MKKVKLSTLSEDTIVLVDGEYRANTIDEILEDLEEYRDKEIYTTTERYASFNAEEILYQAIEDEYNDGMYEDWDDSIKADVTKEDIEDLQKIFDRILARNSNSNITYEADKLIEIDI